jgi:hypothetical protein
VGRGPKGSIRLFCRIFNNRVPRIKPIKQSIREEVATLRKLSSDELEQTHESSLSRTNLQITGGSTTAASTCV